jgi:uncharacterized protein YqjF (DUF2071 family)
VAERYSPYPPEHVARPVMLHRWDRLTFLHWSYPPAAVQSLLPDGLSVEERDGRAWVGLVPFTMHVRVPVANVRVPWVGLFPETNVRTYVRGPDGRTGVWFFSLEAARLGVVTTARTTYSLPYMWARMRVEPNGSRIEYFSERMWPGPAGARCRVRVAPERRYEESELSEFDHYLTARFALWSPRRDGFAHTVAEHPPWELWRATAEVLDDDLLPAAGLPRPAEPPIVHYSPGVDVRIGARSRVASNRK